MVINLNDQNLCNYTCLLGNYRFFSALRSYFIVHSKGECGKTTVILCYFVTTVSVLLFIEQHSAYFHCSGEQLVE